MRYRDWPATARCRWRYYKLFRPYDLLHLTITMFSDCIWFALLTGLCVLVRVRVKSGHIQVRSEPNSYSLHRVKRKESQASRN